MTWCQCGNCVIMPISHEYICYVMKKEESASEISCITNHEGFESVCLKVWVLQAAYFSYSITMVMLKRRIFMKKQPTDVQYSF